MTQGVGLMDWSAQNPDLNPRKHLWGTHAEAIRNKEIKNKEHSYQILGIK